MVWMEAIPDGRTECETKQRGRGRLRSACCFDHWSRCEQKAFRQQMRKAYLSHVHGWGPGRSEPIQSHSLSSWQPYIAQVEFGGTCMELCLNHLTRKTISDKAKGWGQTGEFDQHRLLGLFLHNCPWHLVLWLRERIVPMSVFICFWLKFKPRTLLMSFSCLDNGISHGNGSRVAQVPSVVKLWGRSMEARPPSEQDLVRWWRSG